MSHLIESTDGIVLNRTAAWHGLGKILPEAPTTKQAIDVAGLGWKVLQLTISARMEDGTPLNAPGYVANVRADTRAVLGVVGDGYQVLQNSDLAELIDGLAQDGSIPKCETAGSLRGGRDVFFCVQTGSFGVGLGKADEVKQYVLFANTHDGSRAFRALPTTVRVVCNNTLTAALKGGARDGITIRHSESMPERLRDARSALGLLSEEQKRFETLASALVDRPMSQSDVRSFFLDVYSRTVGSVPSDPQTRGDKAKRTRAVETVSSWLANMNDERQSIGGVQGTAWAALQSVTQWADHERTVREESVDGARMYSNLFGTSAAFKAKALDLACGLVGAP